MAFTVLSKRQMRSVVVRSAAEAGLFALVGAGAACLLFGGPGEAAGIIRGAAAAWLASTAGVAWMISAKAVSPRAFWWAFGGGFFLRLAGLAGLAIYAARSPSVSSPGLLVSYALGVLFMLLIEYRNIKI